MSNLLNPDLYDRLSRYSRVRVYDVGQPMQAIYVRQWNRPGRPRLRLSISHYGETYIVNCPLCRDTRHRLSINHRWGVRDDRTGDDNLYLAKCFNEDCLSTRSNQKELHGLLYPGGRWGGTTTLSPKPLKGTPTQRAQPITLPLGFRLDLLPPDHEARLYLAGRGFDPGLLARRYGVLFALPNSNSRPVLHVGRIVVPIYTLRPVVGFEGSSPFEVHLAGWQARLVGDHESVAGPKYLTATGTPKSKLLYGLPLAVKTTGPAVIVEGVSDVWRVGPSAVALLGKDMSQTQCDLAVRHFAGRPLIVWLDRDATTEAEKVAARLRQARIEASDASPVTIAKTPGDCKDPGECSPEQVHEVLRGMS